MRPVFLGAVAGCALALGACGQDRREPRAVKPIAAKSSQTVRVARAGLSFELPTNLRVHRPAKGSAMVRATLGGAFVSVFAYERAEQIPRNATEIAGARRRLIRAVQARDRDYSLIAAKATEVAGHRAVELTGRQTFSRTPVRIRSLHVYRGSAEYVIEVAAPVRDFPRFDAAVMPRLTRSLQLTGHVRAS